MSRHAASDTSPKEPENDPILQMRGIGCDLWSGIDADAYVRSLREPWGDTDPAEPEKGGQTDVAERGEIWRRVVEYQGAEFKTIRGLPFTHEVEGDSGIWFWREGHRINQRLSRREVEEAIRLLPLHGPTDLREFRDPSYLYGLLTDQRIIG